MSYRLRSVILWIIAVILTAGIAYYQRVTGPTYPVRTKVEMRGSKYSLKFLRTADTYTTEDETYGKNGKYLNMKFEVDDPAIIGTITYRRYKSHDEWTSADLERKDGVLVASFPEQPWAGKTEYTVSFTSGDEILFKTPETVILRFKGPVPDLVLVFHILLIFLAMLFSTRAGIAALARERQVFKYTWLTLLFLIPGGMIMGPIMQKYAFGAYWTGWPFGGDLTDNKTAIALLAWILAFIMQYRRRERRGWALAASIILLAVYLVPHSVLGSEIDYRETEGAGRNIESEH